ncbi:MAG TPA: hypothetical protein VNZ26_05670 [Vicinamibacterales bacterium]|nr:hypothetical protein [Vicinamibacterales bacterium]
MRSIRWLAAICALSACHDTPAAFGPHADSLFTALAERYTSVERSPRFAAARTKLIHHALSPSRVFDDTAVWNGEDPPTTRTLVIHGAFENGKYRLFDDPGAGLPTHVGETQQVIHLEQTGKGEYEWTTRAVGAVGSITAEDLGHVMSTLIAAGATHSETELRNEYRAAFPKTTAALGQLFSLDTIRAQPNGAITLVAVSHPEAIATTSPAFAKYIKKYVEPTRFHSTLRDRNGATWFDVKWENGALTISCRGTRDGHLAPMGGGTGVMPDTLVLETDVFTRVSIFSAGMSGLESDVTMIHTPHERGWNFEFHRLPKFHIPLAMGHFMHGSLKRPFEGRGSGLRLALVDSAGAQSLLTRDGHIAVKESTVMKWFGGFGKAAVGDFAGQSEAEENRFDAEVFAALKADLGGR